MLAVTYGMAAIGGLRLPNDAQRVFLGDKYHQGLPGPARGPINAGGRGLIGHARASIPIVETI